MFKLVCFVLAVAFSTAVADTQVVKSPSQLYATPYVTDSAYLKPAAVYPSTYVAPSVSGYHAVAPTAYSGAFPAYTHSVPAVSSYAALPQSHYQQYPAGYAAYPGYAGYTGFVSPLAYNSYPTYASHPSVVYPKTVAAPVSAYHAL